MTDKASKPAFSITPEEFEERIKTLLYTWYRPDIPGYDRKLHTQNVRFSSASLGPPTRVTYLVKVLPEMSNLSGTLHGGCAATLIDALSSTILVGLNRPGMFSAGGVTRSLDLKFIRPAPVGTEVAIICELVHVGKRLALLKAEIRRTDTGEVCIVGQHDKANTDPVAKEKL